MNHRSKDAYICQMCRSEFHPFQASIAKYCSNACKFAAQKQRSLQKRTKVCQHCNGSFGSPYATAKYCTHQCYVLSKKERPVLERILNNVEKTDHCWLWTGNVNRAGYGRIMIDGISHLAHRLMYKLVVGPVADNQVVRHYVCDNPPCCNPDHLQVGTQKQNAADAKRNNRHAHGETSYAKLSAEQAIAVWHDPRTHHVIAKEYGIGRRTVGHIKNGSTWQHLGLGRAPRRR